MKLQVLIFKNTNCKKKYYLDLLKIKKLNNSLVKLIKLKVISLFNFILLIYVIIKLKILSWLNATKLETKAFDKI